MLPERTVISRRIPRFVLVATFVVVLLTWIRMSLDVSFSSSRIKTLESSFKPSSTFSSLDDADALRKITKQLFKTYKTRIRADLLAIHGDTGLPHVLYSQILNDLRPFKGIVVKKQDLLTMDFVIKIIGSAVTMEKGLDRTWNMQHVLRALKEDPNKRLKNVSTLMAFNLKDSSVAINRTRCKNSGFYSKILKYHGLDRDILDKEPPYKFPLFSMGKISPCFDDILIPYHTMYLGEWFEEERKIFKARKPWAKNDRGKINQAVWRGSTTGGSWSQGRNHRYRLAVHCDNTNKRRMQQNQSLLYDAFFSRQFGELHDLYTQEIHERNLVRPDKHVKDDQYFDNFAVLLDMDGFGFTDRFPRYQFRDTALVKLGLFDDILTRSFIDGVHLFHPSIELTELDETVEWLMNNKDLAEEMMILRKELFFEIFTPKNLDRYIVELARCYADYVTVVL